MFEELIQNITSRLPAVDTVMDSVVNNQYVARVLQGYGNLSTEAQQRVKWALTAGMFLLFILLFITFFGKVLDLKSSVRDYEGRIAMLMEFEQKYSGNQKKLRDVAFVDIHEKYGSAKAFVTKVVADKINPKGRDFVVDVLPGKRKKGLKEVITRVKLKNLAYRQLLDFIEEIEKYKSTLSVSSVVVESVEKGKDLLNLRIDIISTKKI